MSPKPLPLLAGIALLCNAAPAEVINLSPTGLAEPVRTITFDEFGIADDTRISANWAHLGVTFLPNLYYRTGDHPDWDNITGPNLRSGNLAGNVLHRTFSLSFDPPLLSAAFVAIAQPPTPTTFTAKFNGVPIESFDSNVVIGDPNNYFGFTGIIFDEIEVAYTAETRMRIDNLQIGTAVDLEGPPLDVTSSGDDLVFTWESESGRLYNLRSATEPAAVEPKEWSFYEELTDIQATPPLNTLTIPRPADPFRLFVVEEFPAPPVAVFADDFESGQGDWITGSEGAEGTVWELGAPTGVGPAGAHSPTSCFGTNLSADYGTEAIVWLRSPVIDLTTAAEASLIYYEFRDIEEGFDFATLSILDAADDSELVVLRDTIDGVTADWEEVSARLPAEALGKSIRLQFRFQSDDLQNFAGWYIDDVTVTVP